MADVIDDYRNKQRNQMVWWTCPFLGKRLMVHFQDTEDEVDELKYIKAGYLWIKGS